MTARIRLRLWPSLMAVSIAGLMTAIGVLFAMSQTSHDPALAPVDWPAARVQASEPDAVAVATGLVNDLVSRSAAFRDGFLPASAGRFVAMPAGSRTSYTSADAVVMTRTCDRQAFLFDVDLLKDAPRVAGPCAAVRFDDNNGRALVGNVEFDGTRWVPAEVYRLADADGAGPYTYGVVSVWPASEASQTVVHTMRAALLTDAQREVVEASNLRIWLVLVACAVCLIGFLITGGIVSADRGERRRRKAETVPDAA